MGGASPPRATERRRCFRATQGPSTYPADLEGRHAYWPQRPSERLTTHRPRPIPSEPEEWCLRLWVWVPSLVQTWRNPKLVSSNKVTLSHFNEVKCSWIRGAVQRTYSDLTSLTGNNSLIIERVMVKLNLSLFSDYQHLVLLSCSAVLQTSHNCSGYQWKGWGTSITLSSK